MSNIRYSTKLSSPNTSISYKYPSTMHFKSNDQFSTQYGINNNSHVSSIGNNQTPDVRGNIKINHYRQPGTSIQLNNLNSVSSNQFIKNGYCYNYTKEIEDINTIITNINRLSPSTENTNKINELNDTKNNLIHEQTECTNYFTQHFNDLNEHVSRIPYSNIIPSNIPPLEKDIFPLGFDSCRNKNSFSSATRPTEIDRQDDKPVYGTKRAYDITGPRIYDSTFNTNTGSVLNTSNSGYTVSKKSVDIGSEKSYGSLISEPFILKNRDRNERTVDNKYCCKTDQHCKSKKSQYKSQYNTYNEKCGTKSNFGSISQKIESDPQISQFVQNNIIGKNTNNINKSSFYFRNKATFNNKNLQDSKLNLNSLKSQSHINYIENTNKLRDEVSKNYLVQNTDKMKNNLLFRG